MRVICPALAVAIVSSSACDSSPNEPGRSGTLTGQVEIGPICPVEIEGQPCPVPSEMYAAVKVRVFDQEEEIVGHVGLDTNGRYIIDLPPGRYLVELDHDLGIPPGDPGTVFVRIMSDEITEQNFSIDTGIR